MKEIVAMMLALAGFVLLHLFMKAVGTGLGKLFFSAVRNPVIKILTPRYRKKAIQQQQQERQKQGLPPVENPDLH
jgi:hypothetical protein